MKTVLVLGGYGSFGARLSRRLAADGWRVQVAGRDQAKARAFAAGLPAAQGITADRNGDLAALLAEHRPDLVIDAAGPFQGSDYRVARACIEFRIAYCDLADAHGFVAGIGALDQAARAAGVAVISGASSVPALSGAIVRELASGMDDIRMVDMSISASNRATAGRSVASAILGTVGRPVALWRGRQWVTRPGWQMLRRDRYALEGSRPLNRLVALADIPDHQLLPDRLAGKPATIFRAGPEFTHELLGLWLLSWPVRWGWFASAKGLAGWLLPLQRLGLPFCSGRSAMQVTVKGLAGDDALQRRWTLLAEAGDGPEIPTLAAQLLARRLHDGALRPGAYDAGEELALADLEPLLAERAIRHGVTSQSLVPAYRKIMGAAFDRLPGPVRAMHCVLGDGGASGSAKVTRGTGLLARLVAAVMRFPPAGEYALHVDFEEHEGRERWTRNFGGHVFSSELEAVGRCISERFGPMRFHFDLPGDETGLAMVMRKWTAFGIPMPLFLGPRTEAREWAEGETFCFDVGIALPLIGPVVHYSGRLRRDS